MMPMNNVAHPKQREGPRRGGTRTPLYVTQPRPKDAPVGCLYCYNAIRLSQIIDNEDTFLFQSEKSFAIKITLFIKKRKRKGLDRRYQDNAYSHTVIADRCRLRVGVALAP